MTLVKICGLTRRDDVALAVAAGAWACGFVLTGSPRRVSPTQARDLTVHAGDALTVGVFGAEPAAEIAVAVLAAGVEAVQLSAGRDGCTVAALRAELAARRASPAHRPSPPHHASPARRLPAAHRPPSAYRARPDRPADEPLVIAAHDTPDAACADLVLFDARLPGRFGGTGTTLDWRAVAKQARRLSAGLGVILAGGLSPTNVAAAIAAVRPYAVDVSSGVETAPGIKDPTAVAAFIAAAHRAEEPLADRHDGGTAVPRGVHDRSTPPQDPRPGRRDRGEADQESEL